MTIVILEFAPFYQGIALQTVPMFDLFVCVCVHAQMQVLTCPTAHLWRLDINFLGAGVDSGWGLRSSGSQQALTPAAPPHQLLIQYSLKTDFSETCHLRAR